MRKFKVIVPVVYELDAMNEDDAQCKARISMRASADHTYRLDIQEPVTAEMIERRKKNRRQGEA